MKNELKGHINQRMVYYTWCYLSLWFIYTSTGMQFAKIKRLHGFNVLIWQFIKLISEKNIVHSSRGGDKLINERRAGCASHSKRNTNSVGEKKAKACQTASTCLQRFYIWRIFPAVCRPAPSCRRVENFWSLQKRIK